VETENKEKIEELNQKIGNTSSTFNTQLNNQIAIIEKNIEEVKSSIPTIPSDLNANWEKENASREIPTIPSDLNEEWETVKENAGREISTIPSDLNEEWDVLATVPILGHHKS
jgi:hypothetical protein